MSVVEAEKRTNRASVDSEVFELLRSSFVLEPDYADIEKRLWLSQPLFCLTLKLLSPPIAKVFNVKNMS